MVQLPVEFLNQPLVVKLVVFGDGQLLLDYLFALLCLGQLLPQRLILTKLLPFVSKLFFES